MNPLIFRQYDIRGVVDKDLTEELRVDRWFRSYYNKKYEA